MEGYEVTEEKSLVVASKEECGTWGIRGEGVSLSQIEGSLRQTVDLVPASALQVVNKCLECEEFLINLLSRVIQKISRTY